MKFSYFRYCLFTFILFYSHNSVNAQLKGSVNSIIIPVGHFDITDYDNENFRLTIGLGFERRLTNRLNFRTILKKNLGKYNTGKEDHFTSGKLNAFSLKSGFNFEIIQIKRFFLEAGLNYVYMFSESRDGFAISPGFHNEPWHEKEIFYGCEFNVEFELNLIYNISIFSNAAFQYGQNTIIARARQSVIRSESAEYRVPFIETIGIKCKF